MEPSSSFSCGTVILHLNILIQLLLASNKINAYQGGTVSRHFWLTQQLERRKDRRNCLSVVQELCMNYVASFVVGFFRFDDKNTEMLISWCNLQNYTKLLWESFNPEQKVKKNFTFCKEIFDNN